MTIYKFRIIRKYKITNIRIIKYTFWTKIRTDNHSL